MQVFGEYETKEKIAESSSNAVYRVEKDGVRYIIKGLSLNVSPLFGNQRLKKEYEICCKMYEKSTEHFLEPVEFFQGGNSGIVWKDQSLISLKAFAASNSISIQLFYKIAKQALKGLHRLHSSGIIHRDISPRNFLINPKTMIVFLSDFGSSSYWREFEENLIQTRTGVPSCGTYQYMSPEHTGKVNRSIDYRSDIYSLGIVFYEMICGKTPLKGISDKLTILYGHVALHFPPLHVLDTCHSKVPLGLSNIIEKMIKKDPEERYQSCLGLYHDLDLSQKFLNIFSSETNLVALDSLFQIEKTEESDGANLQQNDRMKRIQKLQKIYNKQREDPTPNILPFELGTKDRTPVIKLQTSLFGREREQRTIINLFNAAMKSDTPNAAVVVIGESGSGKTVLINKTIQHITEMESVADNFLYIKSRFQQHAASSMQCVEIIFLEMLRAIHNVTEDEDLLIQALESEIGDDIPLLTQELIPDLRRYFPTHTPPNNRVNSKDQMDLLREAVCKWVSFVVGYLSKKVLILFIDDLQWGDDNAIKLLKEIFNFTKTPIFFFFAARDQELQSEESTKSLISQITSSNPIRKIVLAPLNVLDVSRIVGEMLGSPTSEIKDLAELVLMKTKGNPYYVSQFITQIYNEEALRFHFKKQEWVYDLMKIEARHCTSNVVTLLVGEMKKLAKPTRKLLEVASAIGPQFHIDLLCEITNIPQTKALPMLIDALQQGFIQPKYISHGDSSGSSLATLSGGSLSGGSCSVSSSSSEGTSFGSLSGLSNSTGSVSIPIFSTVGTKIFCFHHSRVHEGFYKCLTRGRRRAHHYQLGKILIQQLRASEVTVHCESKVQRNIKNDNENAHTNQELEFYNIIHHLVIGQDLIPTISEAIEFYDVFYEGAVQARKLGNISMALFYIEKAYALFFDWFDEYSSWDEEYMRTIDLLKTKIEIQALSPDAEVTEDFEAIFHNIHENIHRLEFRILQAKALSNSMRYSEINELVLVVLEEFGFKRDENLSNSFVCELVNEIKSKLQKGETCDISTLCNLPSSEDKLNELILSFIHETLMPIYLSNEIPLFCALVTFANTLTIKHGLLPSSCVALAALGFAMNLCQTPTEDSQKYIQRAIELCQELESYDDIRGKTFMYAAMCGFSFTDIRELQERFEMALFYSTRAFDLGTYSNTTLFQTMSLSFLGRDLPLFLTGLREKLSLLEKQSKPTKTDVLHVLWSMYESYYVLLEGKKPKLLLSRIDQKTFRSESFLDSLPPFCRYAMHLYSMISGLHFENLRSSAVLAEFQKSANQSTGFPGFPMTLEGSFYFPLVHIALNRQASKPVDECEFIPMINESILCLQRWNNDEAIQARLMILEAEKLRIAKTHNSFDVLRLYDGAFQLSAKRKQYQISGIAAEAIRNCYITEKIQIGRADALELANKMYHKWGALAITENLAGSTKKYSIDQSSSSSVEKEISVHNLVLGLVTEILTHEKSTNECIEAFCEIILQHAGADVGFIFYEYEKEIYVLADWNNGIIKVHASPSKRDRAVHSKTVANQMPFNVVEHVIRSSTTVTSLEDVPSNSLQSELGSICCVPIKNQKRVMGAIYMENTLLQAAFPPQRQNLLEHLGCQIVAILERKLNKSLNKKIKSVQKRAEMLESLNKMKDDFVASTSHELRTPLNAIIGFTEILRETQLDDNQSECCEMVYASAEGLLAVINDILDFQQCQRESIQLEKSNFDLRKLLDNVLRLLVIKADANVELVMDLGVTLPHELWINCDRLRLQQILLNLLSNAVKFTADGSITIRITVESNEEILNQFYGSERDGVSVLYVCVEDTGIGIDESQHQTLFKPFSQLDSGPTRKYQGTGLGLVISQNFVRMLSKDKSRIQIQSEVGKGTKFFFHLPITWSEPDDSNDSEAQILEESLKLLKDCVIIACIHTPTVQKFLLYEIRRIESSEICMTYSLDETSEKVKEMAATYPDKKILCFIDPSRDFDVSKALLPFATEINPFPVHLFMIASLNRREKYHIFLASGQHNINIISKPFYKNMLINRAAASIYRQQKTPQREERLKSLKTSQEEVLAKLREETETKDAFCVVLMVEDNKMNQRVQTRMLTTLKIACDVAQNGEEGVAMYKAKMESGTRYALILMDFHMPIMGGKDATRCIRELEAKHKFPATHIIGLTADPETNPGEMCTIIGKPVKKDRFTKVLSSYINVPCNCAL